MYRLILILTLLALSVSAFAQPRWQIGTPIVTYYAGPEMTPATAAQMAAGNLNLVWCYKSELDTVRSHKLRALLRDPLLAPATLDDPAKRQALDALIASVKSHPALYAYYLIDEPSASRFPEFGKLVAYLRERDPAHMAYINLFPCYASNEQLGNQGDVEKAYRQHLQQFLDLVKPDLLSYDHYHFRVNGDAEQYFLNLGLIREYAQKAAIPFMNIVQACSWDPGMRVPHTAEVRWLVNTSLAYGAQGISYYVYAYPNHRGALATLDGQPTLLYEGLKSVNRDFAAMAAQLQPLHSQAVWHCGTAPWGGKSLPAGAPFRLDPPLKDVPPVTPEKTLGFVLGYFGPQGGAPTHVVVVNLDYERSAHTTLVAPGKVQTFNPASGRWTDCGTARLSLRLPAGGCKLIRLAQ